MPLDKDTLEEMKLVREEIVEPIAKQIADRVDTALAAYKKKQDDHDADLSNLKQKVATLESKWGKVLVGFLIWTTIASALLGMGVGWIRKKLGL